MPRKLTPSERAEREREREERSAARREKTEARRKQARQAKERQEAQEKRAKAAKTNQEISKNKGIVSEYNNFTERLGQLHTIYNPKDFVKDYEKRLERRTYDRNHLPPNPPFKEKEFNVPIYQIKPFQKMHWEPIPPRKPKDFEPTDIEKMFERVVYFYRWQMRPIIWLINFFYTVESKWGDSKTPYIKGKEREHDKREAEKVEKHDKREAEKKAKHDKDEAERKARHEEDVKKKERLNKEREEKKKTHEAEQERAKKEWEANKKKVYQVYKEQEGQNEKEFNKEEDKRLDILKKAQNGDIEHIELIYESVLPLKHGLYHPKDFVTGHIDEYDVAYDVSDSSSMDIVIQLPEFDEVIPTQQVTISPTGTSIKYSALSNQARNKLIDQFICSLAFEHVICSMRAFPHVSKYNLEAFILGVDTKTGGDKENIILKVNFDQSILLGLNLKKIDPVAALDNFDHEFKQSGKKSSKEIQPNAPRDQLVWSAADNKGLEIPYGVHPDETSTRIPR